MFGKKKNNEEPGSTSSMEKDRTLMDEPSKAQIKRATRTRFVFALISSFLLLLSVIFMILVEVGNTSTGNYEASTYFIRLNLTNIIPTTVPDSGIINSIAQSLGLHDFYQVGLWNFCEGYNAQGVTDCSKPQTLYWFNPVQIILNELLAGATSEYLPLYSTNTHTY